MGSLEWGVLDERARSGDTDAVRDMLCAATEVERVAFGREVKARLTAMRAGDWRRGEFDPSGAFGLAVLGSAPSAAVAESLLGRRDMRDKWARIPVGHALTVVQTRNPPWLGDLGARLGARLSGDDPWERGWPLVAALCAEAGVTPPAPRGVIAGWIGHLQWPGLSARAAVPFADRLRTDPYLDLLLPVVFETDDLGADLAASEWDPRTKTHVGPPAFPTAVAELVASGRLDRAAILAATAARLARGGGPGALRPFALLHDALTPAAVEIAGHTAHYTRMLADGPATVAGLAQRSLRAVDDARLLDLSILLEVSGPVLVRPVKSLVKAQLTWLGKRAAREPGRAAEILETVAVAFAHPAGEIQDRALTLIERHAPELAVDVRLRLAAAAGALDGDLALRAARLSDTGRSSSGCLSDAGGSSSAGSSVPSDSGCLSDAGRPSSARPSVPSDVVDLVPQVAASMPPPIGSPVELAEEIGALLHEETPVRWERVLAALVTLRTTDDLSPLRHLTARWDDPYRLVWPGSPQFSHFGALVRRAVDPGADLPALPSDPVPAGAPDRLLSLRIVEIYTGLTEVGTTGPLPGAEPGIPPTGRGEGMPDLRLLDARPVRGRPAALVGTPSRVDGSLDAGVLVERLRRAETEGWEPWPIDFEQALLRLPRGTGPGVAGALTSAAGRRLAAWLAAGGFPDPVSTRVEQRDGGSGKVTRLVADLAPTRSADRGGDIESGVAGQWLTLARFPDARWDRGRWIPNPALMTAALPHHREVNAAWALSLIAGTAVDDAHGAASVLPLLAESDGPAGPAMALALAYALTAGHRSDRIAATDAFLILAARRTRPDTRTGGAAVVGRVSADAGTGGAAVVGRVSADAGTGGAAVAGPSPGDAGIGGILAAGPACFAAEAGRALAALVAHDLVKLGRAVAPLRDAYRAGAAQAVWEFLAAALPGLIPGRPRGLPDILELATQVAATLGVRGEVAGLSDLAAARGGTRLLIEARRLSKALAR